MSDQNKFLPRQIDFFGSISCLKDEPAFDGSQGINRKSTKPLIAAVNDIEAIKMWLGYADKPSTFRAYEIQTTRLLFWSILERRKPISSLVNDDFEEYFKFLASPPAHWLNSASPKRTSPDWTPLRACLTHTSINHAKRILNSLMQWLSVVGYLKTNPISQIRIKRSSYPIKHNRYLATDTWEFLISYIINLPKSSKHEEKANVRAQMIFYLFYLTAAKTSDVVNASMRDIQQDKDGNWWWHFGVPKDQFESTPISDEMLDMIKRYRILYGLTPLPHPGEKTPLIFKISGPYGKGLDADSIYRIIKTAMGVAATIADQCKKFTISAQLREASPYWLRHTSLTHQINAGVSIASAKANARHSSIFTTLRYVSDVKTIHEEPVNKSV